MSEKDLIKLWHKTRSQIIAAQMQPVLVLIAAFVLSTLGYFDKATDSAKYFALVVIAITGILTTVNQYAAIREGESICEELSKVAKTVKSSDPEFFSIIPINLRKEFFCSYSSKSSNL